MADTAALVVALSAQLTKFEKDMKDAVKIADTRTKEIEAQFGRMNQAITSELSSFASAYGSQIGGIGRVLASIGPVGLTIAAGLGAATLAVNALVDATDKYVERQRALRETAETTGLSLDQLKALGETATRVGIDFEKAERGIIRMAVAVEQLRTKGSGPLFDTLNKINPALVDQIIHAKDIASAIDILAGAMSKLTSEQQQLAFGAELFGRRQVENVRLLKELFASGGLQAIVNKIIQEGRGADEGLNARLVEMKRNIEAIEKKTANIWGKMFAPEIISTAEAMAKIQLTIAQAVERTVNAARQGKPLPVSPLTRQALEGGVPIGDLGAPAPRGRAPVQFNQAGEVTTTVRLPPSRPTAQIEDTTRALEEQRAELMKNITFNERFIGVLGDAVTQEEQFKTKQLQINKAIEEYAPGSEEAIRLTEASRRALEQLTLQQREALLQLRERLGIATEEEVIESRIIPLMEQRNRGMLTATEYQRALNKAVLDGQKAYEAMLVAASRTPELTRFALDAANGLKQFEQFATTTFSNFENTLADVAVGTSKLSEAFKKMADSIIRDLIRITLRMAVTGPLAKSLEGLFAGGGIGNLIFGGGSPSGFGRQHGGQVKAGSPYIVGEKGAELFIPKSAGSIVPHQLASSGGMAPSGLKVTVNNYASGQTETTQERRQGPTGEELIIGIVKKVTATGELDSANRGRFGLRANKVR
jgi:Lambda phage tail tape-measure protein (Tape_meas_lam_C)